MQFGKRLLAALALSLLAAAPARAQVAFAANGNTTVTAGTGTCTPSTTTLGTVGADDIVLLVVTGEHDRDAHALTTANGFVQIGSTVFGGNGDATEQNPEIGASVWWVRGSSWTAAPVVTDTGNHTSCALHRFTGAVTSGDPWDVFATGNDSNANDTSAVIPGATTTVADTFVVLIQGTSNNATSSANCGAVTNGDLASITERFDRSSTSGLGGGHCIITGTKASIGAYANSTLTMSVTTYKGAMSLALKPAPPPTGVQWRSNGAIAGVASGNITCTAPAGIQDGDILVFVSFSDDSVSISLTGWTVLDEGNNTDVGARTTVLYKVAASESGNYTFTHTGGSTTAGVCMAFSGADTTTPFGSAHSIRLDEGNVASVAATSITPTVNDSLIVLIDPHDNDTVTVASYAGGSLTWTERADLSDGVTSFKGIAIATAPQSTAAAIAPTATQSGAAYHNTVAFALKPAPACSGICLVQSNSGTADSATSIAIAYSSNVTSGNLLIITMTAFKSSSDPFVVGDISQSAGTATLGAFQMDVEISDQYGGGATYQLSAVFSAAVTGTGSCTITVAGAPAGSYFFGAVSEWSGLATSSWLEDTSTGGADTGAPTTGSATSAAGALYIGAVGTAGTGATTHTVGADYTQLAEEEDGGTHQTGSVEYRIVTSGTTDAADWVAPTTIGWAASLAVYKVAPACSGICAVAGQATGATTSSGTSVSVAFPGNITSGNLIIVAGGKYSPTVDDFVLADVSKTAGTATIGSWTMDVSHANNFRFAEYVDSVVYSAPVTGTGSCTVQIGGALASSALLIAVHEFTGVDVSASRVDGTNTGGSTTGAPATGTVASTAGALFVGIVGTSATVATTHTPGADFTQIFEEEDGLATMTGSGEYRIVPSSTTDAADWAAPTTVPWDASLAVYKVAAGGAPTCELSISLMGVGCR